MKPTSGHRDPSGGAASPRSAAPATVRRGTEASLRRLHAHREGSNLLRKQGGTESLGAEVRAQPGRLRHRDRMFFFTQLAIMTGAGVPLAVALDGIARQCDRLKMREVLREVLADVESGQSLSAGLQKHPKAFPVSAVYLVRAGEASGDLEGMLQRISALLERDYEMRKKLKGALTYPIVMLSLAVVTIVALFTVILPRFRVLYAGKEDKLPGPTKVLLGLGDAFSDHALLIVGGAAAAAFGAVAFLRTPRGRSFLHSALLALPVMGGVIRRFSLARSVRALGALLSSGVPVLTSLELARDLSANLRLQEAWDRVREHVQQGGNMYEGMAGQEWFPGTLVQMTAVGEQGGILDSVLVKIGQFYDQEAEVAVAESTSLLEPLMVVIVGGVVGFIAMAIMLPIFNMSKMV